LEENTPSGTKNNVFLLFLPLVRLPLFLPKEEKKSRGKENIPCGRPKENENKGKQNTGVKLLFFPQGERFPSFLYPYFSFVSLLFFIPTFCQRQTKPKENEKVGKKKENETKGERKSRLAL
jgi:hypothetical protein